MSRNGMGKGHEQGVCREIRKGKPGTLDAVDGT
jgi:hypothetical protein